MPASAVIRYRCDLAVVGAGLGGMTAALSAAQAGLSVRVFEKLGDARHLCNSRLTGGIFHIALDSLLDPPETIAARIRAATDGTAEPALTDAVAGDALRALRWLQQQGIRFMRSGRDPWQQFTLAPPSLPQFGRRWQGRSGDLMLRTLEARLGAAGGSVLRGHRAEQLLMRDERCVGFAGTTLHGQPFAVDAHAVVIADGGFQTNPLALQAHGISPEPAQVKQRNAQTGYGDGLRMAQQVGAAATGLSAFYGHVLSRDSLHNELLWPFPWADDLVRSGLVVGPDGRRFADEGHSGVYMANALARLPDPASALVIFDDAVWQGPGKLRAMSANPFMERAGGTVHRAPTLSALAALAGLPADALIAEIDAYNAALAAGTPQQLQPPRSTYKSQAWPVRRAPFYAVPIVAGITYTMGGIRIDGDARVQSTEGAAIEGLYAVGAATGGLEGGPRVGYVGGLVKASVTGLRAGEHAAAAMRGARPAAAPAAAP